MDRLNEIIKSVWDNKIENDFRNSCILNEDTLKNAFYCHLRNEMEKCIEYSDFRIYTECNDFGFSDYSQRPDLIIAKLNKETQGKRIEIEEIVAVIEFKYKSEKCTYVCDEIMHDVDKLKDYHRNIRKLSDNCRFYIGAITLGDFTQDEWIYDKRTIENWGKGRITELIAYEPNGELEFMSKDH
ncbi:MAG: hypothetical protein ACI4IE_03075 [Eubacterium sp.]